MSRSRKNGDGSMTPSNTISSSNTISPTSTIPYKIDTMESPLLTNIAQGMSSIMSVNVLRSKDGSGRIDAQKRIVMLVTSLTAGIFATYYTPSVGDNPSNVSITTVPCTIGTSAMKMYLVRPKVW